jgi:hypothetical protein
MDKQEDGSHYHAHIIHAVEDHNQDFANHTDCVKFVVSVNDDEFEDVVTYNELMDYFGKVEDEPGQLWKFCCIVSHQGPLKQNHPDYNGSMYNIMLEWENGEKMPEPLNVVAKDNPITFAVYAKENRLLDAPGWKQFKPIACHHKKFLFGWSIKPSFILSTLLQDKSIDMRFQETMIMPFILMKNVGVLVGKTLLLWSLLSFMSTKCSKTLVTRLEFLKGTRKFMLTLSMIASMMVNIKLEWLWMAT